MKPRVVITGIGVIAPGGTGTEAFWNRAKNGVSAVGRLTRFEGNGLPATIAAEVRDFEPRDFLPRTRIGRMERSAQFALSASILACQDSRLVLDPASTRRAGVFEGTALGGLASIFDQHRRFLASGERVVEPSGLIREMSGNASSSIALHFHLHGPAMTFAQGCVSSSYAIHCGFRKIQTGELDVAFVGGSEAPL